MKMPVMKMHLAIVSGGVSRKQDLRWRLNAGHLLGSAFHGGGRGQDWAVGVSLAVQSSNSLSDNTTVTLGLMAL